MRAENPPMAGRDHLAFRSYYFPVKHFIANYDLTYVILRAAVKSRMCVTAGCYALVGMGEVMSSPLFRRNSLQCLQSFQVFDCVTTYS